MIPRLEKVNKKKARQAPAKVEFLISWGGSESSVASTVTAYCVFFSYKLQPKVQTCLSQTAFRRRTSCFWVNLCFDIRERCRKAKWTPRSFISSNIEFIAQSLDGLRSTTRGGPETYFTPPSRDRILLLKLKPQIDLSIPIPTVLLRATVLLHEVTVTGPTSPIPGPENEPRRTFLNPHDAWIFSRCFNHFQRWNRKKGMWRLKNPRRQSPPLLPSRN